MLNQNKFNTTINLKKLLIYFLSKISQKLIKLQKLIKIMSTIIKNEYINKNILIKISINVKIWVHYEYK